MSHFRACNDTLENSCFKIVKEHPQKKALKLITILNQVKRHLFIYPKNSFVFYLHIYTFTYFERAFSSLDDTWLNK